MKQRLIHRVTVWSSFVAGNCDPLLLWFNQCQYWDWITLFLKKLETFQVNRSSGSVAVQCPTQLVLLSYFGLLIWQVVRWFTSIWGTNQFFFWSHWYQCFGFLVTSALGFKTRLDLSFAYFLSCVQWIPQIRLWCDPRWPLVGQHGSREFFIHIVEHVYLRCTLQVNTTLKARSHCDGNDK